MNSPVSRKIMDRIRKLLALGRSPHPEEASSAFKKAEALMKRYGLSTQFHEDAQSCSETIILPGRHIPEWRKALAGVTASYKRVEACLYSGGNSPGIRLKGKETDVRRAEELYRYLDSQIAEISPKYETIVRDIEGFRLGMVAGIEERLEPGRKAPRPEDRNVVVPQGLVEKDQPLIVGSADPNSYGLGKAVGRKIPLP